MCNKSDALVPSPLRCAAWLCPSHAAVVSGLIPPPTTLAALRALFPARVTEHRRTRAA